MTTKFTSWLSSSAFAMLRQDFAILFSVVSILLLGAMLSGCTKHPQVTFSNRTYAAALRTACSAQDRAMLEKAKEVIERDRSEGRIGEEEMNSYESIIAMANSGDWKEAEIECHRFQKDQLAR